jgi:menaquinone-9 beta-reductase
MSSRPDHSSPPDWDVIIIGAGVAGASAAILTARQGMKTLLVDAKKFPREKVCGGCLNLRAQASLGRLNVLDWLHRAGAVPIDQLNLRILSTAVRWSIPTLLSIRRSTLDSLLVDQAIAVGATFADRTTATVMLEADDADASPFRRVTLRSGNQSHVVEGKLVIAADGLTQSSTRTSLRTQSEIMTGSRIGAQLLIPCSQAQSRVAKNELVMCVGRSGYVGLSPTDGAHRDIAAALDASVLKGTMHADEYVQHLMQEMRFEFPQLSKDLTWRFTPHLTRSSSLFGDTRLLLIGDALGYVEPFTGEGMSWALASAEAVAPIAERIVRHGWTRDSLATWSDWIRIHHVRRQSQCRWIAGKLRHPRFAAWFVLVCQFFKPLRTTFIKKATS